MGDPTPGIRQVRKIPRAACERAQLARAIYGPALDPAVPFILAVPARARQQTMPGRASLHRPLAARHLSSPLPRSVPAAARRHQPVPRRAHAPVAARRPTHPHRAPPSPRSAPAPAVPRRARAVASLRSRSPTDDAISRSAPAAARRHQPSRAVPVLPRPLAAPLILTARRHLPAPLRRQPSYAVSAPCASLLSRSPTAAPSPAPRPPPHAATSRPAPCPRPPPHAGASQSRALRISPAVTGRQFHPGDARPHFRFPTRSATYPPAGAISPRPRAIVPVEAPHPAGRTASGRHPGNT